MKEIQYVVFTLGQKKLRVVVNDHTMKCHRTIGVSWKDQGTDDGVTMPPRKWAEGVIGELEFQRGQEGAGTPMAILEKFKRNR
jgi:hypothetical protein